MKYTIIDSAMHSIMGAKSKKELFNIIKESTPFYRNQTDKQFMEGYSIRRQILGLSSLDTTSVDKFIDSCVKNGLIVKGIISRESAISKFTPKQTKGSKSGIGGRVSIDKKVDQVKARREMEKRFDKQDEALSKKLSTKKEIEYRLLDMQRREKRRNEGLLPKNFSEERERKFPKTKKS
jgi:hypothetical protein